MLLILLLAGCSNNPGDNELRNQVIPVLIKEEWNYAVEVKNLHKTNGYQTNANTYTVDIAYDLVFKVSFDEIAKQGNNLVEQADNATSDQSTNILLAGAARASNVLALLRLQTGYGHFKTGDSFKKQDRVTFIKTENRWQLSSQPETVP